MEHGPQADDIALAEYSEWFVEGHPIRVAYSSATMEAMRQLAWEGLQKVPRRGLEVGGILFGSRTDDHLKIREWRPIHCEHAKGPGFELSPKDEEELRKSLEAARNDPELREIEPLGWFHSHTRDGVTLTKNDLDIYNRFFPAPWQICLVLRPHLYESTKCGFFFREADGSIRSDSSYKEFALDSSKKRYPSQFNLPEGKGANASREERRLRLGLLTDRLKELDGSGSQGDDRLNRGTAGWNGALRRSRWSYALIAVLMMALLLAVVPLIRPARDDRVSFSVRDTDGWLLVEWNKTARPVLEAEGGTIWITDGDTTRQIRLTPDDLRTGILTYAPQSNSVEFRLTLERNGEALSELADFSGRILPAGGGTATDSAARQELQEAITKLRSRLEQETARNANLRRALAGFEKQFGSGPAIPPSGR